MPNPRQQRTSQRRRNAPNPGGAQIIGQDWLLSRVTDQQLLLQPADDGVPLVDPPPGLVIAPPLSLVCLTQAFGVVTIVPAGIGWQIDTSELITWPSRWKLRDMDPAWRSGTGQWLVGKTVELTAPVTPPSNTNFVLNSVSGNDILLDDTSGNGDFWWSCDSSGWLLNGVEQPTESLRLGTQLRLTFPAAVGSGDHLESVLTADQWSNVTLGSLTPVNLFIP